MKIINGNVVQKMDRDIFRIFLQDTYIRGGMPEQEAEEAKSRLLGLVAPYVPKKLYRYRAGMGRDVDALRKEEIWFSKPKKMNDLFDTLIGYDPKKVKDQLMEDFFQLQKSRNENNPIAQSIFSGMPNSSKDWEKMVRGELKTLSKDFQDEIHIACFSEEINSPSMWGNYANENKGFALAYDFEKFYCEPEEQRECYLLPVIYGEKPYDSTDFMRWYYWQMKLADNVDNQLLTLQQYQTALSHNCCPDELAAIKAMLYKSKKWKEEKEWRLISYGNEPDRQKEHFNLTKKPVALYLGYKIEEKKQNRLEKIAQRKKIPVYKMEIIPNTYKLRAKLISSNC